MSSVIAEPTQLDLEAIRQEFPVLQQKVHGHRLVYLDNAATTQKPNCVIDAMNDFYRYHNANVHRGVHALSELATADYENARETVRDFIHAKSTREIIFVRGATEAINLVAQSYGGQNIQAGDNIVITEMEHHANIVPWQILCEAKGATLRVVPVLENGELDLQIYQQLLDAKTKLVAFTHVSNVLGTVNPAKKMVEIAHAANVPVLIDGAQAVAHQQVDVQDLQCDFYVISAHKMFGPAGIGVLYAKEELLNAMPPYQTGGEMISQVSFKRKTTFNELPFKFEAGTPNVAGAVGMAAAIRYLQQVGLDKIQHYERQLLNYATERIKEVPGLRIVGNAADKSSLVSMIFADVHAHDVGTILDHYGIAVRSGHHCAMPLIERYNVPALVRASFAFYNLYEEVDILIAGLNEVNKVFS